MQRLRLLFFTVLVYLLNVIVGVVISIVFQGSV